VAAEKAEDLKDKVRGLCVDLGRLRVGKSGFWWEESEVYGKRRRERRGEELVEQNDGEGSSDCRTLNV